MREATTIFKALGRETGGEGEDAREIVVTGGELVEVMSALKRLGDFILLDIDAVDRPDGFYIAYRLLDRGGEGRVGLLTVRAVAGKADPVLPSVCGVWKAADVLEREVWDLMGVRFEGRDGLKRILCKDDFEGHPLRKDFIVKTTPRFPGAAIAEGAKP